MNTLRLCPVALAFAFASGCGGEAPVTPTADRPSVPLDAVVADRPTADRPPSTDVPPARDASADADASAVVCTPLVVSPTSVRMATNSGSVLTVRGGSGGGALFAVEPGAVTHGAYVSVGGGIVSGDSEAHFTIVATDVPCMQSMRIPVDVVGPFAVQPSVIRAAPGRTVRFVATGALGAVQWSVLDGPTGATGRIDAATGVFTTGTTLGTYRVRAMDMGTDRDLQVTVTVANGDAFGPRVPLVLVPQGRSVPLQWRGGSGYVDAAITSGTAGGRIVTVAGNAVYSAEGARPGSLVITGTDRFTMERDTVRVVVGDEVAPAPIARGAQNLFGDVAYGDLNGDGMTDLVVGQGNRSASGNETGGVLVFNGRPTGYPATPDLVIEGERDLDHFGTLVSARDVNHDGISDLIVGSPDQDLGRDGRGAVSVLLGSRGGLVRTAERTFAGEAGGDRFGTSFLFADLDGDMDGELIVAAPNASNTFQPMCRNAGRVYVYQGQHASRGLFESLPWQTLEVRDRLDDTDGPAQCRASADAGRAMALWDADTDGHPDLIVGVSNPIASPVAPTYLGAVLVYRSDAHGVFEATPSWAIHLADAQRPANAHFGFGLDVVTAGGRTVLVVRSPTWTQNAMGTTGTTQLGAFWVFRQGALGARATTAGDIRVVRSSVASARFVGADNDGTARSAALADLNGDGRSEYIIGGASDRTLDGVLHAFDAAALAGEGLLTPVTTLRGEAQQYLGARIAAGTAASGMGAPLAVWAAYQNTTGGVAGGALHLIGATAAMSLDARWMMRRVMELPVFPYGQRSGAAVAAGPIRATGATDAVVGSPGQHSPAQPAMGTTAARPAGFRGRTGALDVFRGGSATSSQTLWVDRTSAALGSSIALLDFNGDGRLDIAVGDPGATAGGSDMVTATVANAATDPCFVRTGTTVQRASIGGRGIVRVFQQLPDGRFEERFQLVARETIPMGGTLRRGGFGFSLSGGFDANGDGIDDLLVGHSGGATTNGAEVVLGRAGDPMGRVVIACNDPLTAPSWASSDAAPFAGQSVSFVGDIDQDGCDDAVVSLTGGRVGASVQLGFDGSGAMTPRCARHTTAFQLNIVPDDRLLADNVLGDATTRANDFIDLAGVGTALGSIVGGGGDVTGDAFADVILRDANLNYMASMGPAVEVISGAYLNRLCPGRVCAEGLRDNFWSDGAYHVVGVRPLEAPDRMIIPAGNTTTVRFGASICAADVDGDGHSEVLVGSPDDSWGGPFVGAFFGWHGGSNQAALAADPWMVAVGDASEASQFGASCAGWGVSTRDPAASIAVGAPLSNHRGALTGAAFRWRIER